MKVFVNLLRTLKKNFGYSVPRGYKISYAQEAEDIFLEDYFQGRKTGFYVDVGAHHPVRFSNTYKLYLMGWRGINIDPLPGVKEVFGQIRPRDTTLEMGVADRESVLKYFRFDEPALNGFDEKLSHERAENTPYKLQDFIEVPVRPLRSILTDYVHEGQKIDLLSVDVEGLDYEVLNSNDWLKFRPEVIVAELRCEEINSLLEDKIYSFLHGKDYRLRAWTGRSCIFISNDK